MTIENETDDKEVIPDADWDKLLRHIADLLDCVVVLNRPAKTQVPSGWSERPPLGFSLTGNDTRHVEVPV
jgi:hypothetical protein